MQVTTIGHAGLMVQAGGKSIVCDPWFEPAFFASWFVFPRNDQLSDELMAAITNPDYLYISHLHGDHLDAKFLGNRMNKNVSILLPDYPSQELEGELRKLGFANFIRTTNAQPLSLGELQVVIHVETSITDGPGGDSAIVISDSTGRVVNQNDCRTHDVAALAAHGPVDVHYLQFSGAIWYPMVYEIPEAEMRQLVSAKVESQFARSFKYVESLNAQVVAPSAGPPCFLDDDLFAFNVISGDELSIFPDQSEFLRRLSQMNLGRGVMNIPGTVVTIQNGSVTVTQPCGDSELNAIFANKSAYLQQYKADWAERIAHEKTTWGVPGVDVLQTLKLWWEPLMSMAPTLCSLVGANCLIRSGANEILIDFAAHQVRAHANEPYGFRFEIPSEILESVISVRAVDWSNSLFLSCRFKAWREGEFNEYLYNFFKSLNPDRMSRTESEARGKVVKQEDSDEIELGGYTMERYCPHRKADLSIFGECDGKVLTCTLHGWKFDLETGKCLTADDKALRVRRSNN